MINSKGSKSVLLLVLLLLLLLCTGAINDRVLKRSNAKKWKRVAEVSRITARSGARQYLEDSSSVSAAALATLPACVLLLLPAAASQTPHPTVGLYPGS